MKFLTVLLLLFSISVFADEPPSYMNYEVKSGNSKYTAKITCTLCNEEKPWDQKFKLSIFDRPGNLIWETEYHHSGYPSGYLSDDGKLFVYLEYWYFENDTVLSIYSKSGKIINYKGKDFDFNKSEIVKTVSHELWLNDMREFRINTQKDKYIITFFTIDSKEQIVSVKP